jgi:hypothetical protein
MNSAYSRSGNPSSEIEECNSRDPGARSHWDARVYRDKHQTIIGKREFV